MNPLDNLPVSQPITVHDWAAFRELHRHDLSSLDIETLAALYGFSSLTEYHDDDCLQSIERMMDESGDPVRARYDLAWNLGEFFNDEYFYTWRTVYTPEERATLDAINNGAFVPAPNGRQIQPGEPGYVSEIPAELHTKVVGWLVEGIKRFRNDDDLFQHVRTIAARAVFGDTFLDKADIEQLRQASNDELTMRTDKRAQEMIREMVEKFNKQFGRNDDGTIATE
jgi:hypothetical protein